MTVPELDGTQAETPVHDDVPTDGLATVRRGIFGLGSQEDGRSTRRYTDTVTARHA
ncbi:hypothetical protein ACQEU5_08440 [Marinactinospora thermotolerans]|uniref:hypothetical protein n=1 Tax=Marinactinospora thermotolerans TaxID=531310 RepID=UPI0013566786|nr:hypothetical protein [Marinactinospora thermotolerans]